MKRLEKGFTLIELMIVVAIIAILAAVAAPRFGQQIKKAQDAKAIQIIGNWRAANSMYYSDNQKNATSWNDLDDNVDTKTIEKTYDATGNAALGTGATTSTASSIAGTGTTGTGATAGKQIAKFAIEVVGTEAQVNFTSDAGIDTKNTSWSAY